MASLDLFSLPPPLAATVNSTGRAVPGPREVQDAHLTGHRFAETRVSIPLARKLVDVAKSETYVRVRSQLASTAKRLPADQALPLIDALSTHNEDADDIHIPLLLWRYVGAQVLDQLFRNQTNRC